MPKNDQIWPKTGIFGQFGPGHAGLFSALLVGRLVVVARGLYLARHLFTLCLGVDGLVRRTENGFACGYCSKEFVKESNCKRHVKETHLNMGQFRCPYCEEIMHRSKIQNHMNSCYGPL